MVVLISGDEMPAETKQIVTSLKVDPDLWKEAKIEALKNDITLGELIDQAVRDWIKKHRKQTISDEEAKKIAMEHSKKGKEG